jgi:hypothetical protein
MKLSKRTLELLKNYATINPSIVIPEGQLLQTMATSKNIVSYSEADEAFPVDFAIYDLFEFIKVIELFDDPEFEFEDTSVTISDNNSSCVYIYAEKNIIDYPKNKINFPKADVSFRLTKDQLDKILRAANTLNLPFVCITKDGDNLIIKVTDPKNPSSNNYSLVVGEDKSDASFEFYINYEYFKMIKDDYQVDVSKKNIAQFTATDGSLYYLALEKNSTYTE